VVEVDGRKCRGLWRLCQGGRVRVTSFWGSDEVDCCPPVRPEAAASEALVAIVRTYPKRKAAELKRERAAIDRVNRYWDRQKKGLAK
jgi:hypothetical protein